MRLIFTFVYFALLSVGGAVRCKDRSTSTTTKQPTTTSTTTEPTTATTSSKTSTTGRPIKKKWTVNVVPVVPYWEEDMITIDDSMFDDDKFLKCNSGKENIEEMIEKPKALYGRKRRDIYKKALKTSTNLIPVLISTFFSDCQKIAFANAMKHFEQRTCVRFVPYVDSESTPKPLLVTARNYANNRDGVCYAQPGYESSKIDGKDTLSGKIFMNGFRCVKGSYTFRHEFMHFIGFSHPENSPFREGPPAAFTNFPKLSPDDIKQVPPFQLPSIVSNMWNSATLTDWDIYKVNSLLNCTQSTRGNMKIDNTQQPPEQPKPLPSITSFEEKIEQDPYNCHFNSSIGENMSKINAGVFNFDTRTNTRYMTSDFNSTGLYYCFIMNNCRFSTRVINEKGEFHDDWMWQYLYGAVGGGLQHCVEWNVTGFPDQPADLFPEPTTNSCKEVVTFNNNTMCFTWDD